MEQAGKEVSQIDEVSGMNRTETKIEDRVGSMKI
jgi:hypothetical protein